jgi:hypothetical protein
MTDDYNEYEEFYYKINGSPTIVLSNLNDMTGVQN